MIAEAEEDSSGCQELTGNGLLCWLLGVISFCTCSANRGHLLSSFNTMTAVTSSYVDMALNTSLSHHPSSHSEVPSWSAMAPRRTQGTTD